MKVRTEIVRGRPIQVEGRTLVPVVRQTTGSWQQATIGNHRLAGRGGGFVHLHPLGVVEQKGEEERFIPIPDVTARMLVGLFLAAVVVPLLLVIGLRLLRR